MPASAYNVGADAVFTLFTSAGIIDTDASAGVTSFKAKQLTTLIKDIRISGQMYPKHLPEGWEGSFIYTRVDSALDDYFADLEASYYQGNDLPTGTITQTITNVDGTISEYRFEDLALMLDDAGNYEGNKEVKMGISFVAGRRIKVL